VCGEQKPNCDYFTSLQYVHLFMQEAQDNEGL
jgi:hypothetical protein